MDITTYTMAGATVLSGLLIVFNEWIKRCLDRRHKKSKFELWAKIYSAGVAGREVVAEPILQELLEDGLIELEFTTSAVGGIIQAYAKGLKH